MSNPATLENLPVELKLNIFRYLDDTEDLKALVHASPACHQAYLGAREEIFTLLTFRVLQRERIDILKPALCVHVSFRHNAKPPKGFEKTLRFLWGCMKEGEIERARLSIGECRTLLGLTDCIRFYQEVVTIDKRLSSALNWGSWCEGKTIPTIRCALPCIDDCWRRVVRPYNWTSCSTEACKCCPRRWGSYHGFDSSNIFGGPFYVDLLIRTPEMDSHMSSWSHGR